MSRRALQRLYPATVLYSACAIAVLVLALRRAFDNLHTEHHARPWDGHHFNGTIRDTWQYMVLFGVLSFLAPLHAAPVPWASVMQLHVIEEWVHHSVHYFGPYRLGGPYWTYMNRAAEPGGSGCPAAGLERGPGPAQT